MRIQLFNEVGQPEPTHEFTITGEVNHVSSNSILHYAPTDQHYTYFNRSKGVVRFRRAEVVSINTRIG